MPFYVSAIDGPRYALMLGPFATHAEALARVQECRDRAYAIDGRSHFWAWGTCQENAEPPRLGRMNRLFGLDI